MADLGSGPKFSGFQAIISCFIPLLLVIELTWGLDRVSNIKWEVWNPAYGRFPIIWVTSLFLKLLEWFVKVMKMMIMDLMIIETNIYHLAGIKYHIYMLCIC